MDGRVAQLFSRVLDRADFVNLGYEIANEIPWQQIAQLVQWTSFLEGLGWPLRTFLCAGVLVLFSVCETIRRTWGLNAYERWNIVCEYLAHTFFGLLVGPVYVLICLSFKLMGANRFRDCRRILVIAFFMICFPTLVRFWNRREQPAPARWFNWF